MFKDNPKFPTPADETGVWRYMTLDKYLSLLVSSKLQLARADSFADPWEGAWPQAMVEEIMGLNMEGFAPGVKQKVLDLHHNSPKRTFVSCWHMSLHESAAMWELYGGKGASVAIRSDVGRLKTALTSDVPLTISSVKYINYKNYNEQHLREDLFATFFMKRESFSHESELRIVATLTILKDEAKGELLDNYDWEKYPRLLSIQADLESLVQQVFVSPFAGKWFTDVVRNVTGKYIPHPPEVIQSTMFERAIY